MISILLIFATSDFLPNFAGVVSLSKIKVVHLKVNYNLPYDERIGKLGLCAIDHWVLICICKSVWRISRKA